MRVIPLTKDKEHAWDHFVEHYPEANMYHLVGWKQVFESVFGYAPYYFWVENGVGEMVGILPMFFMRDILRRKYLVSNPFCNFAGICAKNQEAVHALLETAKRCAAELQTHYVEFRQMITKLNNGLPSKDSFVTLMLDLPSGAEDVWQKLSSRNRNKIRRAEKSGLRVDFGMKYLKDFYAIYAKNLRFLGTPVFPLAMFEKVAEVFADRCELLVLKLDGRPVSGMFLFKFKDVISEPWVASLREYNRIYVNNFLYWHGIKYACDNGFRKFDFGRSTVDSGTYRFKQQWGAEPVPLHYQYYLHKAKRIPIVDAHNNKYQKLIEIWKRAPLRFTNFIGPKVVQFLPEL